MCVLLYTFDHSGWCFAFLHSAATVFMKSCYFSRSALATISLFSMKWEVGRTYPRRFERFEPKVPLQPFAFVAEMPSAFIYEGGGLLDEAFGVGAR